ncbi:hypothetical protein M431DRAFT_361617 [Trichoderma harzianum CBS 226.95]|uniref:Uncharacterized protein n=1 Tax=Trichoderma harzianum CBS 226.95 TaxID=983964 RepID=A0A2T4AMX4_TRIHA|nr:hypothetical protein M431DRAFT_361617 [Trichoderma harzianum CBS 226.95]PTB58258.1 hypothetical protein M431DRAFT_361617 [Trichoderma harzianum CBS 226.95]
MVRDAKRFSQNQGRDYGLKMGETRLDDEARFGSTTRKSSWHAPKSSFPGCRHPTPFCRRTSGLCELLYSSFCLLQSLIHIPNTMEPVN